MNVSLPGLSSMNLKKDMIHFQDEILKDMRQMQSKLDTKYSKSDEMLIEKLTNFDLKIIALEKKVTELSNLITEDNSLKEKLESLIQFKEEIQDTIFKRRAKFAEFEKKVNNDIDEINKILTDSVVYPAIIGKSAKFQTFHEFIDFVVQEISQLNLFKNKSQMDSMTSFKKKIDGIIEAFKIQIHNLTPKEVTYQIVNDLEKKMNNVFKIYDDRLQDTRVENANYSVGIQKKAEEMDKHINSLMAAQKYINKKLEKVEDIENLNVVIEELSGINPKINKIFNILRDLASYHPEVKKNYYNDFEKKEIISGVKQYIKGKINADELNSMKKFGFKRAKTKMIDTASFNSKKTQNVSPENLFNNNLIQKAQNTFLDSKPNNIGEENSNIINKKFLSKKTINLSRQENIITNNLNEGEKNQKSKLKKKNTANFDIFSELPQKNNYLMKPNKNNDLSNKYIGDKINNIIEEENEINNDLNNSIKTDDKNDGDNSDNKNINNNNYKNIDIISNDYNINDNNKNTNKNLISEEKENNKIKANNMISNLETKNYNKKDDNIHITIPIKSNNIEINDDKKEKTINISDTKEINSDRIILKEKEAIKIIDNNINKKDTNYNKNFDTNINKFNKLENKKEVVINSNRNNNLDKEQKERKNVIKNYILTGSNNKNNQTRNKKVTFSKEESDKNEFSDDSKFYPKITKLNLQNILKSQESFLAQSERKNNKNKLSEDNKILTPMNYNYIPKSKNKSNSPITKKSNKIPSNFPKLNQDNNISISPLPKEIFTKTITGGNFYRKEPKTSSFNNYHKKILLVNPDHLPKNYFEKTFQDFFKKNLHLKINKSEIINNHKNKAHSGT